MIPYFNGHLFDLKLPFFDTVPIHMFGVLVALGVIIGDRIVVLQGRRRGLDDNDVKYLNARIVIGGFIVAHLVSVIFYYPERIAEDWRVLVNPFAGLSSFGGFLGAFLAFMYFTSLSSSPRRRPWMTTMRSPTMTPTATRIPNQWIGRPPSALGRSNRCPFQ